MEWWIARRAQLTPGLEGPMGYGPKYHEEGFLTLQHLIDINFMRILAAENDVDSFNETNFSVANQRFPYPPYVSDEFIPTLSQNLPTIILLCLIYLAQQVAKFVVVEKETGLKVCILKV